MVLGRCRAALPISGGSIRPALAAWCRRSYASAACAYRLPDRARRARWPNGRASVRGCGPSFLLSIVFSLWQWGRRPNTELRFFFAKRDRLRLLRWEAVRCRCRGVVPRKHFQLADRFAEPPGLVFGLGCLDKFLVEVFSPLACSLFSAKHAGGLYVRLRERHTHFLKCFECGGICRHRNLVHSDCRDSAPEGARCVQPAYERASDFFYC